MAISPAGLFDDVHKIEADWESGIINSDEALFSVILALFNIPKPGPEKSGLDSVYNAPVSREWQCLAEALYIVGQEAVNNAHKRPKMTTLLEEVSELYLSFRGKHDDLPELELRQVSSVAINILWQLMLYDDQAVNNVITNKKT